MPEGEEVETERVDDSEKCLMGTTPEPSGNGGQLGSEEWLHVGDCANRYI